MSPSGGERTRPLREADRRKEEFLAVLSHERYATPWLRFRQAARPVKPGEDVPLSSRSRELSVVARQARHLTRLVDDLLDISRINRGRIELHKEVVVLEKAVAEVIEAVKPLIDQRQLELHVTLPAESIRLDADPTRLEQIFLNLLTNAVKYTNIGGRIELRAERTGDEVVVRVQDTGIGIASATLPRIFDWFVQGEGRADRSQGGLGIGLSLVKTLVEKHGGSITAHSQGPGTGSEFVVRLPVHSVAPADGKDAPQPTRPGLAEVWPRRRILIVDDNVVAADGLGKLLTLLYGQEVRVVYDRLDRRARRGRVVPAGARSPRPGHVDHGRLRSRKTTAGSTGMRRGAARRCDRVGTRGGPASIARNGFRLAPDLASVNTITLERIASSISGSMSARSVPLRPLRRSTTSGKTSSRR